MSTPAPPSQVPPPAKVHTQITDPSRSALRKYQSVIIGSSSLLFTMKYELVTALGQMPGAIGLFLRKKLYPRLLEHSGRGVLFGPQVVLRHPRKIHIGDRVVVSDGAIVDARGEGNEGIRIGDDVLIGQRALVQCKGGSIHLDDRVAIGAYTGLFAIGTNVLHIEADVMIGPYAYLGGTQYHRDRLDIPMTQQGHDLRGGIRVEAGAWIGAHANVMDGIRIGRGAIVAAGAVVTRNVDDHAIVAGVPAKVIGHREQTASS